jgi:hypothetical protein
MGLHNRGDHLEFNRIFERTHRGRTDDRTYDSSRRVRDADYADEAYDDDEEIHHQRMPVVRTNAQYTYLPNLSFNECRAAFGYLYQHRKVVWPSRTGLDPDLR